jgi:drug/metabolite transporter (DMT)-like permease
MSDSPATASPEPTRLPVRGLLYLVVLTLTWGSNWPFIKMAVEDMPVIVFRAGCGLTAGVVVLAFAWLSGTSLRVPRENWRNLVLAGFFNVTLWFYLSGLAISLAPSGHVGALAHTIPLWVFLIDMFVFRVRSTPAKWLGLLLGLSAIALLTTRNFQATDASAWGVAAILSGGLSWAIGANIMRRVSWGAPTITVLGWQVLIGGIPLALLALPYVDDLGPIGVPAWIGATYSTLIGVAFAFWLWFKILELVPVWVAAYSALAVPAVALTSGALLLGEPFGAVEIAALVLLAGGVATVLPRPGDKP